MGTAVDTAFAVIRIMSGLFIMVIPFFFLPFMIKKYGGANLDKIAGNLQNRLNKAASPATKFARRKGGESMGRTWKGMKSGAVEFGNDRSRAGRFVRGIGRGAAGAGRSYDQRSAAMKMQGEHYDEALKEGYYERLRDDEAFRLTAAGGDAAADRLRYKASEHLEERSKRDIGVAQAAVQRRLAGMSAEERDEHLRVTARTSTSAIEREAAIHEAARLGRDGVIRDLQDDTHPENTQVDQTAIQRAIQTNASALVGKAPNLVKGDGAALDKVTGAELAGFSKSTAIAYVDHLGKKVASGDTAAINSFMAALSDIQNTPELKAKFDGDVGGKLLEDVLANGVIDPSVKQYVERTIDKSTGRIR